ncbi:MAG: monovalent cation/H(+) antiporter subunit G [Deltaproteobacteria bacterium]|nr:monovalent cation/H(+) antiporter subunit G [Deltaproteobacteria bacterium]
MVIVETIFMVAGLFFFTTATIGFLRFPDFYMRMHATAKGDTLGTLLFVIGLALYYLHHGFCWLDAVQGIKLIFIAVFWFLASPTATHALLRSAFESDLTPWTKDGKAVIEWPPKRRGK